MPSHESLFDTVTDFVDRARGFPAGDDLDEPAGSSHHTREIVRADAHGRFMTGS